MLVYENQFENLFILAPLENLGIYKYEARDINKFYWYSINSNLKECVFQKYVRRLGNTLLKECVFCDKVSSDYLLPVFDVNEECGLISLRKTVFCCKGCSVMVKFDSDVQINKDAIVEQIDNIILMSTTSYMYTGTKTGEEIFRSAIIKKNRYAEKSWLWDFTYLFRRKLSSKRFINTSPDIPLPTNITPVDLLWS